ncbi:MAG: hypothetical protein KatS3mg115_0304 [Candidatus Poribacteria bacterium]|nr:MAG: hypothetical protein KatS3mg115_0304 [Candidatus Poribacteria bacterium]
METERERAFQRALALIAQGKNQEAREQLSRLVEESPHWVEARLTLGVLLGTLGERTAAEEHLRYGLEHLEAVPRLSRETLRAQLLLNLAVLALERDDWKDVYGWEEEFAGLRETFQREGLLERAASVLFDAANRAVRDGEPTRGRTLYERALELDPDFAEAWYNLAVLEAQDEELEQAMFHLERAIAAEPALAEAQFLLGSLLLPQDPERAVQLMEGAVALQPENVQWITLLGSAYARRRDFQRAREFFARALSLDPEYADAHLGYAIASRALGDMESARYALGRAFELNPQLAKQVRAMMEEL